MSPLHNVPLANSTAVRNRIVERLCDLYHEKELEAAQQTLRAALDAAVAQRTVQCPGMQQHTMAVHVEPTTDGDDRISCDLCARSILDASGRLSCRLCDYDVCSACATGTAAN